MYSHLSTSLKDTYSGKALGEKTLFSAKFCCRSEISSSQSHFNRSEASSFKMPEAKIILVDFGLAIVSP